MSTYEIWLDESGNFNDESINNNKVPSLVGGLILKDKKFTEECARDVLGTSKPFHAAEIYNKELERIIDISLDKLHSFNIRPVVFENRERVSIIDPQTTYLSVFAEGIMQLINDLNLNQEKNIFNIYIARRMYKKDDVLTPMKDEEYVSRLRERISLLILKNSSVNKSDDFNINIEIGSARIDRRLMVSDLICHSWFSKSYKFSSLIQDKIVKALDERVYSIIEPGGIASIKQKIKTKAVGEGLFEWIGHYHELIKSNNKTKENIKKLSSLQETLCSIMGKFSRSEKNMQLDILANYIKALVNHSKQFELAMSYINIFLKELVPSLKGHNVETSRIEAEARFSLLTTASNTGNIQIVDKEIKEIEHLIQELATRWENLDFIFEYYVRKGAYLYTIDDSKESIALMNKLEEMVSGIAEISSSILSEEFETGKGTLTSTLLGKIYGVRSQAKLKLSYTEEVYIEEAEKDCYLALEQFESASDKVRQFHTLTQIACLRKRFSKAEDFLRKSLFLSNDASTTDILVGITKQPPNLQSFSLMHYLTVITEAFISGDSEFAVTRFEIIKKHLNLQDYNPNNYPNNVIFGKYSFCQLYIGEHNLSAVNFEQSVSMSLEKSDNILMILLCMKSIAKYLFILNEKGLLNERELKKHLKIMFSAIKKIKNNEYNSTLTKSLYEWNTFINEVNTNKADKVQTFYRMSKGY